MDGQQAHRVVVGFRARRLQGLGAFVAARRGPLDELPVPGPARAVEGAGRAEEEPVAPPVVTRPPAAQGDREEAAPCDHRGDRVADPLPSGLPVKVVQGRRRGHDRM